MRDDAPNGVSVDDIGVQAHAQLAELYPNLKVSSAVQAWVYLEAHERALAAFAELEQPSAEDERWLGVSYLRLFDDLRATEILHRAVTHGSRAAHIHLAHAYLFSERLNDVEPELARLEFETLDAADQVRYLMVKSQFAALSGSLDVALKHAETAWGKTQGIPEEPLLAPQIAGHLSILYARKGRSQRALWFAERSAALAKGLQAQHAALSKVQLYIMLGQFQQAKTSLAALEGVALAPRLECLRSLRHAELALAQAQLAEATELFAAAADCALNARAYSEEFQARLLLATLLGYAEPGAGAAQLARASTLLSDQTDTLHYRFRSALLRFWAGGKVSEVIRDEVVAELESVSIVFGQLGFLQEQGSLTLHLAALRQNDEATRQDLDQLQILCTRLQSNAFLASEWALQPGLQRMAQRSHPALLGNLKDRLDVLTLGEEKLLLNGKSVHIPLRKASEIIAYFLEHGSVSLKRLLMDVFADDEPSTARNYFHQLRHELRERLPGLDIRYLASERLYQLVTELELVWDVAELRAGRLQGERGIFLPSSGSDWAAMLEAGLEPDQEAREMA